MASKLYTLITSTGAAPPPQSTSTVHMEPSDPADATAEDRQGALFHTKEGRSTGREGGEVPSSIGTMNTKYTLEEGAARATAPAAEPAHVSVQETGVDNTAGGNQQSNRVLVHSIGIPESPVVNDNKEGSVSLPPRAKRTPGHRMVNSRHLSILSYGAAPRFELASPTTLTTLTTNSSTSNRNSSAVDTRAEAQKAEEINVAIMNSRIQQAKRLSEYRRSVSSTSPSPTVGLSCDMGSSPLESSFGHADIGMVVGIPKGIPKGQGQSQSQGLPGWSPNRNSIGSAVFGSASSVTSSGSRRSSLQPRRPIRLSSALYSDAKFALEPERVKSPERRPSDDSWPYTKSHLNTLTEGIISDREESQSHTLDVKEIPKHINSEGVAVVIENMADNVYRRPDSNSPRSSSSLRKLSLLRKSLTPTRNASGSSSMSDMHEIVSPSDRVRAGSSTSDGTLEKVDEVMDENERVVKKKFMSIFKRDKKDKSDKKKQLKEYNKRIAEYIKAGGDPSTFDELFWNSSPTSSGVVSPSRDKGVEPSSPESSAADLTELKEKMLEEQRSLPSYEKTQSEIDLENSIKEFNNIKRQSKLASLHTENTYKKRSIMFEGNQFESALTALESTSNRKIKDPSDFEKFKKSLWEHGGLEHLFVGKNSSQGGSQVDHKMIESIISQTGSSSLQRQSVTNSFRQSLSRSVYTTLDSHNEIEEIVATRKNTLKHPSARDSLPMTVSPLATSVMYAASNDPTAENETNENDIIDDYFIGVNRRNSDRDSDEITIVPSMTNTLESSVKVSEARNSDSIDLGAAMKRFTIDTSAAGHFNKVYRNEMLRLDELASRFNETLGIDRTDMRPMSMAIASSRGMSPIAIDRIKTSHVPSISSNSRSSMISSSVGSPSIKRTKTLNLSTLSKPSRLSITSIPIGKLAISDLVLDTGADSTGTPAASPVVPPKDIVNAEVEPMPAQETEQVEELKKVAPAAEPVTEADSKPIDVLVHDSENSNSNNNNNNHSSKAEAKTPTGSNDVVTPVTYNKEPARGTTTKIAKKPGFFRRLFMRRAAKQAYAE